MRLRWLARTGQDRARPHVIEQAEPAPMPILHEGRIPPLRFALRAENGD